jgi:hypothetical protein
MMRNHLAQNNMMRRLRRSRYPVPRRPTRSTLASRRRNVYFPDESHLNRHRVVADALASFLDRSSRAEEKRATKAETGNRINSSSKKFFVPRGFVTTPAERTLPPVARLQQILPPFPTWEVLK